MRRANFCLCWWNTLCDFDGVVRLIQQGSEQPQPLEDPFPFARGFHQPFVTRAQLLIRPHPSCDIVRDGAHHRRRQPFRTQRAVILPDPLFSRSRPDCHQAVSLDRARDLAQIGGALRAILRINNILQLLFQHLFYAVTQQTRWNGIDGQETPLKVVDTQQIMAVLDQIAIPVFALGGVLPERAPDHREFFQWVALFVPRVQGHGSPVSGPLGFINL